MYNLQIKRAEFSGKLGMEWYDIIAEALNFARENQCDVIIRDAHGFSISIEKNRP